MRSPAAIQHAMVRLTVDPSWREAVYAGPVPGLTEPERALIVAVDRRAWATDTHRAARLAQALIDEFPVVAAVIGVAAVEGFLTSEAFAACVTGRGSMALAFGAWAPAPELAALELAIARARRRERAPGPGLVTRPGLEPLAAAGGVVAAYARIRGELGAAPLERLARGYVSPPPGPFDGEPEGLLIEADAAGAVQVGGASLPLVALLGWTLTPRSPDALTAHLVGEGFEPAEARDQVAEWVADGLLVAR